MLRYILSVFVICVAALACSGCPSIWNTETSGKTASADDLYKAAEEDFQKKNYSQAIETYERLKSAHPDFKQIPEAYLKIADSFFEQGQYEKAISRYLQFVELHPGHKELQRAKYQIALAHFNQIKNADLDSALAQRSAKAFKAIMDDPDAGEYSKKAEEKYKECLKKLAAKELYKARTYVGMGNYQAAKLAAKRVLDEYPKLGFDEEANELMNSIKNK
jgi:outer membrane protein assembly factor BamD